jgi:hypothetical protein
MKYLQWKTLSMAGIFAAFLFGFNALPASAATSTSCTPGLSVQKVKQNEVKLNLTCEGLKSQKVNVKVQITDTDDDDSSGSKSASVKLNKKGVAGIKVSGLDSATSYSFKAKVKKIGKNVYSAYSADVNATTTGADYEISIDSIKSITDNSAKLKISCDDLKKKSVNVQVAYKKKSDWSTKVFDLTLDSDGEGTIAMSDLKSDTTYSFKVRIKKSGSSKYSAYSAIKQATTDEE